MPNDQNSLVKQADREAAADFYGPHLARPGEVLVTAHMRAGKLDESPLVQAFARHRIAFSQPVGVDEEAEIPIVMLEQLSAAGKR